MTPASRTLRLAAALVTVLGGCHYGTNVAEFPPARDPMGIRAEYETRTHMGSAELLAVEDTGFVFRMLPNAGAGAAGRVARVPFESVRRLRFEAVNLSFDVGRSPGPAHLRRLRLLSRYPQGLAPSVLERILLAAGQAEVDVVRP